MIKKIVLQNNKGSERCFQILYKIEYNNQVYLVYEDSFTKKIYAGLLQDKNLKSLPTEELNFFNKILEKVKG